MPIAWLILAAAAASATSCPASTPVALVEALRTDAYFFYVEPEQARPYVSDALHAALVRDGACQTDGICAISADPWIDAQDGEIAEPIEVRELSSSNDAAQVQLCFDFVMNETPERQCAQLAIVRNPNGCWAVDDLTAASGVSLRRTFAEYPYDEVSAD